MIIIFHKRGLAQLGEGANQLVGVLLHLLGFRQLVRLGYHIGMAALQAHAVRGLRASGKAEGKGADPTARDRALGVDVIAVQDTKVQACARTFQIRIAAKQIGGSAQHFLPAIKIGIELHQAMDRLHRLFFRKIGKLLVDDHILQSSLFFGEAGERRLIGLIGSQPKGMPQRHFVVVHGHDLDRARAFAKVAVLLVITDANYHPDQPPDVPIIGANSAQDGI